MATSQPGTTLQDVRDIVVTSSQNAFASLGQRLRSVPYLYWGVSALVAATAIGTGVLVLRRPTQPSETAQPPVRKRDRIRNLMKRVSARLGADRTRRGRLVRGTRRLLGSLNGPAQPGTDRLVPKVRLPLILLLLYVFIVCVCVCMCVCMCVCVCVLIIYS